MSADPTKPPDAPDFVQTILWLWHHTQQHREALMKPPVLLAYLLIALGAFYFGSSRNSEEIGVKNERISFLNDQVAAYKDRLQGATPDQAAKQIVALQTELEAYIKRFDYMFPEGQRKLKEDQLKILTSHKDQILKFGKPIQIYTGIIGDSAASANEFVKFFKSQNIPASDPTGFPCYMGERGVLIGLKDQDKPSDDAKTFQKILEDAGIHTSTTLWGLPAAPADSLDFDLYICPSF
jgi:hypothetical protein